MTHKDIFTKFMIEYDKANVTSSYPSLTEYEIATFLDKAYMALIAQKVTGNNVRRAPFEADIKSISDLQPLVTTINLALDNGKSKNPWKRVKKYPYTDQTDNRDNFKSYITGQLRHMPDNLRSAQLPEDFLYFVAGSIPVDMHRFAGWMNDEEYYSELRSSKHNTIKPLDNKNADYDEGKFKRIRQTQLQITTHQIAENFFASSSNIPWVKHPMCYLEDNNVFVVCDPIVGIPNLYYTNNEDDSLWMCYIKHTPTEQDPNAAMIYAEKRTNGSTPSSYTDNNGPIEFHIYDADEDGNISDDTYYNVVVDDIETLYFKAGNQKVKFKDISGNLDTGGKAKIRYVPCTISGADAKIMVNVSGTPVELKYFFTVNPNDAEQTETLDYFVNPQEWMSLTYIKSPNPFVKEDLTTGQSFSEPASGDTDDVKAKWNFELNDIAAEELISLAISYALENVESPRLNAHIGMRGLES